MRALLLVVAILPLGCPDDITGGTFQEISGDGAPAACNDLRGAFCGKGEECIENFDQDACNADLLLDGTDCEDAQIVRADIDGCVSALRDAPCGEAVDGTVINFVPPCDQMSVE